MIGPAEIVEKAERLYHRAVAACLFDEPNFFPYRMPCNLRAPESHTQLIAKVDSLRQQSKAVRGFGYSVGFETRNSRDNGLNDFPTSIQIESMEDLVRLIRKQGEFQKLTQAVSRIRVELPQLEGWLCANWKKLLPVLDLIGDLLAVTVWLKSNPKPNCHTREIPLPLSSKLIEQNWSLLASWWNDILPPSAINYNCDSRDYAERFGFRWAEPHFFARLLDSQLQSSSCVPFDEFSLPARSLNRWCDSLVGFKRAIVVENRVNLITLPAIVATVAMGGLGFGVTQLVQLEILNNVDLVYWGDLDVEGFQALSKFRQHFPHTRSWLMDSDTLQHFFDLTIAGNDSNQTPLTNLHPHEMAAYDACRMQNLRLEQERIDQAYVLKHLFQIL